MRYNFFDIVINKKSSESVSVERKMKYIIQRKKSRRTTIVHDTAMSHNQHLCTNYITMVIIIIINSIIIIIKFIKHFDTLRIVPLNYCGIKYFAVIIITKNGGQSVIASATETVIFPGGLIKTENKNANN